MLPEDFPELCIGVSKLVLRQLILRIISLRAFSLPRAAHFNATARAVEASEDLG
jgi:hypothetical protein